MLPRLQRILARLVRKLMRPLRLHMSLRSILTGLHTRPTSILHQASNHTPLITHLTKRRISSFTSRHSLTISRLGGLTKLTYLTSHLATLLSTRPLQIKNGFLTRPIINQLATKMNIPTNGGTLLTDRLNTRHRQPSALTPHINRHYITDCEILIGHMTPQPRSRNIPLEKYSTSRLSLRLAKNHLNIRHTRERHSIPRLGVLGRSDLHIRTNKPPPHNSPRRCRHRTHIAELLALRRLISSSLGHRLRPLDLPRPPRVRSHPRENR